MSISGINDPQFSRYFSRFSDAFGYDIVGQLPQKNTKKEIQAYNDDKWENIIWTVLKATGYSPGLGNLSGAFKVIVAVSNLLRNHRPHSKEFYYGLLARGVVELSGLGIFLIIPDIIMTNNRIKEQRINRESSGDIELSESS